MLVFLKVFFKTGCSFFGGGVSYYLHHFGCTTKAFGNKTVVKITSKLKGSDNHRTKRVFLNLVDFDACEAGFLGKTSEVRKNQAKTLETL